MAPAVESFDAWSSRAGAIDELRKAISAKYDSSSLGDWCKAKGFPYARVTSWIEEDESRNASFLLAMRRRGLLLFKRIAKLAKEDAKDDGSDRLASKHRKLQLRTLRWALTKLDARYGKADAR